MFKWQWLKKIHKLFQPISIKLPTIIVIIYIVGISADQDFIFRDINQHCISGMGSIHMDQMCGNTAQVQSISESKRISASPVLIFVISG